MPYPDCRPTDLSHLKAIQLVLLSEDQGKLIGPATRFAAYARRCRRRGVVYVRSYPPHRLGWLDGIKGPGF